MHLVFFFFVKPYRCFLPLPPHFRYSLDKNPTGPSATTTVCPKFTPLGQFTNNRAHSNMVSETPFHMSSLSIDWVVHWVASWS